MNLIKPEKLKKSDTIGIVATSGNLKSEESLKKAVLYFENKGFSVVLAENLYDKKRYLAGEDGVKIEQLHKMFLDKNINAIFCMRGGYGAIRLINKIDYDIIRNNPKIYIGYSDITALSAMVKKNDIFYFKTWYFLPEESLTGNPNESLYRQWSRATLFLYRQIFMLQRWQ